MPNLAAPGYYDRTDGVMDSKYDPFFKYVSADPTEGTGDVECPIGYVGLHRLTEDVLAEIVDELRSSMMDMPTDNVPPPGWYITREDNNGLIWAMAYGDPDAVYCEERAREDFAEAVQAVIEWEEREDDA